MILLHAHKKHPRIHASSGNVLFLILIAVALFAALSYVVTQSSRSGSGTTENEKNRLLVAQLQQTLVALHTNFNRLNLGGIPIERIKFHTGTNGNCIPDYTLCSTGKDCLFAPEGGAFSIDRPPIEAFVANDKGVGLPGLPATSDSTNIWIDCNEDLFDWGMGTSAPDRTFYYTHVRKEICLEYNRKLGIKGIPGEDAGANVTGNELSYCYKQTVGPNIGDYEIFDIIYVQ